MNYHAAKYKDNISKYIGYLRKHIVPWFEHIDMTAFSGVYQQHFPLRLASDLIPSKEELQLLEMHMVRIVDQSTHIMLA